MEFLKISDSKLKIMLNDTDMKKYCLLSNDIDYENQAVRRIFWELLDEAKKECGFDVLGDKVLIQFYPSKSGSEIFVTKLGILSSGAEKTISQSNKVAMLSVKKVIYRFQGYDSLKSASGIIEKMSFCDPPRIYLSNGGAYYLIAEERKCTAGKGEISPLIEFAEEIPSVLASYIAEHSEEISLKTL